MQGYNTSKGRAKERMSEKADSLFANIVYRLDCPEDTVVHARKGYYWFSAVTLGVVFLLSIPIQLLRFRNLYWIDTFNHSLLESYCGIISFIIASIIYREYKSSGKRSSAYLFLGFFTMGVYDFFHAYSNYCVTLFVWFHSLSAFSGGLFLLFGALSSTNASSDPLWLRRFFILFGVASAVVAAGMISTLSPPLPYALTTKVYHHLPVTAPIVGEFSTSTITLNVLSATGFMLAGVSFLKRFRDTNDVLYMVFSLSAFLFFESEFLFAFSRIWDISWWYWHVIKLVIFIGLMIGLAHSFGRTFRELQESRRKLTGTVKELQHAYEDLKSTQNHLLETEKLASIGTMAATIAHEIRNPLGAINNSIGIFKRHKQLGGEDKELMSIVEEEIRRLNRTITDFLDFARPVSPERSYEELNQLIEETLSLIFADTGNGVPKIKVFKYLDRALPPVLVDRDAMKQCFWNIFINAVQAMPDGGTLAVGTRYAAGPFDDKPVREAVVNIYDSGAGMSEEALSKVFQPFFSTKARGTGLGLSIVQKIIHSHEGHISITSRRGDGTKVDITLPLGEPAAPWREEREHGIHTDRR